MTTEAAFTHFETLGVTETVTPAELKAAYRKQLRLNHPDIVGPVGEQRTAALHEAFRILSDPELRAAYEAALANPVPPDTELANEPLWGEESDWTDDIVDAPVVDEPVPPAPPPSPYGETEPEPEPPPAASPTKITSIRVRTMARRLAWIGAAGLGCWSALYGLLWATNGPDIANWLVIVLPLAVAVGASGVGVPHPAGRPSRFVFWVVGCCFAASVAVLIALGATRGTTFIACVLAGMPYGRLLGWAMQSWLVDRKTIGRQMLRDYNMFGEARTSPDHAQIDSALQAFVVARPGARLLRFDNFGPVVGAIVDGVRVRFIIAASGPSGQYVVKHHRLKVRTAAGDEEVLNLSHTMRRITMSMPRPWRAVVVVDTDKVAFEPKGARINAVTTLSSLAETLDAQLQNPASFIDQPAVIDALRASVTR